MGSTPMRCRRAGLATSAQGIGLGLGVEGPVISPTFVLARRHAGVDGRPGLVHVDAYRLGSAAELVDLDLDETMDRAVTLIERGAGIALTDIGDETGVGIVRGNDLLANEVASSMEQHVRFGGVVPEVASRAHLEAIVPVLEKATATAGVDLSELDGIAVTAGPGLAGALVVGLSAAKALASWLNKPLYGVNHLAGHVAVDLLEHGDLPMPCGALLVSGGHTSLLRVNGIATDIVEVGSTIDDAAGEAYDKVARVLGLPYPGGPVIDKAAAGGDPNAIRFPRGLTARHDMVKHRFDYSFSGLKTAVSRWVETQQRDDVEFRVEDVAASFQEAVADVLTAKAVDMCQEYDLKHFLIGGGVAANSRLRTLLAEWMEAAGVELRRPRPGLCTDNGAMIAALGVQVVKAGLPPSSMDISADSRLPIETVLV